MTGIDVGTMVDESAAAALRQALSRCRLLLFRQPGLSQDAQIRFTEIFGQLYSSKAYKSDMGGKGYYFSNTREDGQVPAAQADWLAGATEHAGSWWADWAAGLQSHAGKQITAPKTYGKAGFKPLMPAPGSYVLAKA